MKAAYWPQVYRIGRSRGPREKNRRRQGRSRKHVPIEKALGRRETRYNLSMQFAIFAMRLLEVMFFVGLAGSTVVVIISFLEDGKELFGKDEPPESRA